MKKIETSEVIKNSTETNTKNNNKYYLIVSIIFLIFGSILTTNPGGFVDFISYIIGTSIILIGVIRIILYINLLKKYNINKLTDLITGIILCILGIIACIWGATVETIIRIIIGAWILYCGITKLINSLTTNKNKVLLIISAIMIIIGLATIMIKYIEFTVLGILIIIYSISDIIGYIIHNKK